MAIADSLYESLTNEDDARLCRDITDEACRETPRSFVLILISYFLTKLGDAIASPKTTLAWLTTSVGAPAWVLGFLVPIRESGSMIPQVLIGGYIRSVPVRKWTWVAGSVVQALCVAGMGWVAFRLEGAAAGWAILGLVTLFSLGRSFCSIAAKDVLGKTVPKTRRGQLTGWSASAAGLVTVAVGVALMFSLGDQVSATVIGALLVAAAGLWMLAAAVYSQVPEYAGETGGGRSLGDALDRLSLLATDAPFRRFVMTRALLMCSALSAPFYVAMAQQNLGSPTYLLGAFVAASGLASLVSAPFWGRFADVSSKRVMVAAAVLTSGVGLVTVVVDHLAPGFIRTVWFLPLAYFVLMVAHSGVRVGRKTYVVPIYACGVEIYLTFAGAVCVMRMSRSIERWNG